MPATDTYLLLRAFCDEFARCGMRVACTSPGSRNTPLILSLVREPRIRSFSQLDERCAGFFALGAAKASGRAVAVTCTSGTAAANLAPAVIEAYHARVPLIVLTADRPPELRELGAGQTIDQIKLYGDAVKWFFEVGVHEATPARLRWIRTLACRAYWTACSGPAGPVHLNFPLREPLVLNEALPEDTTGRAGGAPFVRSAARSEARRPSARADQATAARPVVVAGTPFEDPAAGARLATWAAECGVPLLADPLSGARRGDAAIAYYDLLLRDREFTARHLPSHVIRAGELPTSKPLRTWLAGLGDVEQIALDPDARWQDPDAVVAMRLRGGLDVLPAVAGEAGWLESWRAADAAAAAAICEHLDDDLSEPLVAARLGTWLPADATLFVASSMPIRDVESFWAPAADPPRVLSNRGANGIDGTVSSAFGAAAVSPGPVVLLVGDVALAHDIGGLLAARRLNLHLTILLLNNDGGGIFHFLPIAEAVDAFEEHVATPHGLDFARAAALYGCEYARPAGVEELRLALEHSLQQRAGTTIIEILTNREQNLTLHRRIAAAVSRPAAAAAPGA
ncbi:MAG: 2-succinyl-5-enolpyruvyl-6-hydroxy-3-cyclohexene-1-carboxylic-acid synthase [Solirubrobacterales bacterium]|nr:2-succinyl-5-enolpyruvyl-6-hydroxy-3-cyclohexene-1-carboxylic-acid synthase [Solirubrobacterales bacterium]